MLSTVEIETYRESRQVFFVEPGFKGNLVCYSGQALKWFCDQLGLEPKDFPVHRTHGLFRQIRREK